MNNKILKDANGANFITKTTEDGSLVNTPHVNVDSIPLATGAATSAIQTTQLTELQSINSASNTQNTYLEEIANYGNVAAREATLQSINLKTPTLGTNTPDNSSPVINAVDSITGNITTQNLVPLGVATAGSAVEIALNGSGSIGIQVTGTYTGALSFQYTDNGTTWITMTTSMALNLGTGIFIANISSSTVGKFIAPSAGSLRFRISALAAVTGTATITLRTSSASFLNYTPLGNTAINSALGLTPPTAPAALDITSAAITASATTAAITQVSGCSYQCLINVTAATGTLPTMDINIEESDDGGTNWFVVYSFPRITTTGAYRSPKLPQRGSRVRYVQTIGGTTPSFTRTLIRHVSNDAVNSSISQLIDRTIVLTTPNSVTLALNIQNATNVSLTVNVGAITTTAPQLQLEGSEDNGLTWYAIGTPLTAVASSTVNLTVATPVNSQLLRARVSTAGVGVTAGYTLIKGF